MSLKKILRILGRLMIVEAIMMALPLIFCIIYHENFLNYLSFLIPMVVLAVTGFLLTIKKEKVNNLYSREGFILVGLSWVVMSIFGAIPFMISGVIPNVIDALFETISGFTTTGASIVEDISSWNEGCKSLLFWRSFTHWIGGMGVLVFVLAILPQNEGQNIFILRAESTGPSIGKLVSKLKVTARILYIIYFAFTLIETIMLACGDMTIFEAINHSLATAGTGGFSTNSNSIAAYSDYSQIVIAVFMMLFAINFNIFYFIFIGKAKQALKSEELRWYLIIVTTSVLIIAFNLFYSLGDIYQTFPHALKDSFFQVTSIISTTGFATADFALWPAISKSVLFILMFIGGCAGSTGGGIKVSRFVILFKSIKREIKNIIHPHAVTDIKFEGTKVDENTCRGVSNYFVFIMFIILIGLMIISIDGFDFETNITAVVTCVNNVGPGLSKLIGPLGNFSDFNPVSKLVLSFLMLIGRLEIYPILILFNIKAWKNK